MGIQQCIILSQGRTGVISYHKGRGSQNGVGGCKYTCSDSVGVSEYREAIEKIHLTRSTDGGLPAYYTGKAACLLGKLHASQKAASLPEGCEPCGRTAAYWEFNYPPRRVIAFLGRHGGDGYSPNQEEMSPYLSIISIHVTSQAAKNCCKEKVTALVGGLQLSWEDCSIPRRTAAFLRV